MAAPKGHTFNKGKSNRKGKPNKVKKETKELIKCFVDDNFEEAMRTWATIPNPADKVKTFIALFPYCAPRLNNITVEDANGNDIVKQILNSQQQK